VSAPHDRDLDRLLDKEGGEFGALYRRLPRVDPPRRLDRNVLGEAARAVHGRTPPGQRWIVGLGSAAGLVLAAGIAWHVGHEALQPPAQDAHRSGLQVVPVEPISDSRLRREREPAGEARNDLAPPAPAVPPPAAKAARKPAPRPAPAPPAAFPESAPRAQSAQPAAPEGAAAGALHPADRSPPASDALDQAMSPRLQSTAPSGSVELRRDMQLAPADWLAHVRQLLREDRRQQASDSLRLFRRVHPDQRVPEDLRGLTD
jgi:hypothetical protein